MNYQVCEPLSPEEFAALKDDIAVRGVMVPVEIDENGDTLDGHHRIRAWAELRAEGVDVPDYPVIVRAGMTEAEKRNHARKLNALRRQMTKDQRDNLIVAMREDGMSYRQIGEVVGISHEQARSTVKTLTVEQPTTITGRDGKERPATMPLRQPKSTPVRYADLDDDGWGDPGLGVPVVEVDQDDIDQPGLSPLPRYPGSGLPVLDMPGVPTRNGDDEEGTDHRLAIHWKSETPEHYTPDEVIQAVLSLWGRIDLDPCGNSHESPSVPAAQVFTVEDDGLAQVWQGRTYMNPPYGRGIDQWVEKLVSSHEAGLVTEAIALLPARTDTQWIRRLDTYHKIEVTGRLKFINNDDPAPFPSVIFYLGDDVNGFYWAFRHFGPIWIPGDEHWFNVE